MAANVHATVPLPGEGGRIFVRDLPRHVGQRVVLPGWLAARRRVRGLRFVDIRDRTGSVQAVCRGDLGAQIDALPFESAIRVAGTPQYSIVRRGTVEIEADAIDVLAPAETPLPLEASPSADARLDYRYLDLRSRARALVFEVQSTLEAALREFLTTHSFLEIHTPKISSGGSESGAAVFELDYFGRTACLIQSPQFYMQLAMAAGFDRVFEVGPVFRAENAITNRHATEFTCVDVELSWINSHEDLMDLEEDLLRHALRVVGVAHGAEIERICGVAVEMPDGRIPRIPVSVALELAGEPIDQAGPRLTHQAEQLVCRYARERYGSSFVFLTDYPARDRPFYTMHEAEESETAFIRSRSFDLLWRGLEVSSGCQREHRADRLRMQAAEAELSSGALARYLDAFYCDMFRYGCPAHGGFGIGLNRLLMAVTAQSSIRETSFVFRGPNRCVP